MLRGWGEGSWGAEGFGGGPCSERLWGPGGQRNGAGAGEGL